MSSREAILGRLRMAAGGGGGDEGRRLAVEQRLAKPPKGVIPERGQLPDRERLRLFRQEAERVNATMARVRSHAGVPAAVAAYLRSKNLPAKIRVGHDRRLNELDWSKQKSLTVKTGASDGDDLAGLSHALAGVAETGTLVLHSGRDNPTTINFLPEHHIVVVDAKDITGDLEAAIGRLRRKFGRGEMPRTLNLITGPSRSADIEQTLLLGAHGPRALHIIMVGG